MSETRYLISEASKLAEVESHVLRYWEEELKLPIARNEMGHRYYTKQDIQIFLAIKELKRRGFQLKMIRELIPRMEDVKVEEAGKGIAVDELLEVKPFIEDKPKANSFSRPPLHTTSVSKPVEPKSLENQKQETSISQPVRSGEKPRKNKMSRRQAKAAAQAAKAPAQPVKAPAQVAKTPVPKEPPKKENAIKENSVKAEPVKNQLVRKQTKDVKGKPITSIPIRDIKKEQVDKQKNESQQDAFYQIMERLFIQLTGEKRSEDRYKRLDAAIRKHQYSRRMVAATEEQGKKRKKK